MTTTTIETTDYPNGVTVTIERTDGQWTVTATETETDDTLAQWTTDDEAQARTLRDNVADADLSDLV